MGASRLTGPRACPLALRGCVALAASRGNALGSNCGRMLAVSSYSEVRDWIG